MPGILIFFFGFGAGSSLFALSSTFAFVLHVA
jgi:hypothetical protein